MKLQFSTCALCRPELIEKTYNSWTNKMKGVNYKKTTLFIDIAPIPEEDAHKREEVLKIAKSYFGNVIYNLPSERNFPKAMDWCWSSASSDFLFHLEDDWELNREFHINDIFYIMDKKPYIQQISIRHLDHDWRGITFSPGLLKKHYYKTFAGKFIHNQDKKVYMSYQGNPEAFMRQIQWDVGITFENVILYPEQQDQRIVTDIGALWKKERDFFKTTYLSQYYSE